MNYMDLGKRIREERKKLNMTQETLAEFINVTPAYVGQIERGERCPTLDTLIKISNHLGVTIDYLLQESIEPSNTAMINLWLQLTANTSESEKEMYINLIKLLKNYKE